MTRRILYASIVGSSTCLAVGYALRGVFPGVVLAVLLGALWLYGAARNTDWIASTLFLVYAMLCGTQLLIQAPAFLELGALLFALAAWDLQHFQTRLDASTSRDVIRKIERVHFFRLGLIVLSGGLMSAAAMLFNVRLPFPAVFLMGGALVLILTQIIYRLAYRPKPYLRKPTP